MSKFTESDVEEAALEWLQEIGYSYVGGPDIAPGEPAAERASYTDVILAGRLRDALAFYDALATNESAVEIMGDEQLASIARELIEAVRKNVTIDWTIRASARARIRVAVERILRRHGYPPDLQERRRTRCWSRPSCWGGLGVMKWDAARKLTGSRK
jgi:hypothetical protein